MTSSKNKNLTASDVAAQFNVTHHAVRNWIRTGLLPAERFGNAYVISAADANAFKLPLRGAPKKKVKK